MHQRQAILFALFIMVFTLTAAFFFTRPWLPSLASTRREIDHMITIALVVTGIAFIVTHMLLAIFAYKYRHREGHRAAYWHENTKLEVAWTTITALILFLLVGNALRVWSHYYTAPPSDAFKVEVTGQQFAWNFRYPGPDHTFGRTDPALIDEALNPYGIDDQDEAAYDDICPDMLYLPAHRPVEVLVRSKDVIHSFFLPHFRVKQDAVPGMTIHIWFVPDKPGTYEIACAEHCGHSHFKMRGTLVVLPPDALEKKMEELAADWPCI